MTTLARQRTLSTTLGKPYSIPRDNQFHDLLEAGFNAVLPPGVLEKGAVTLVAAYTLRVEIATVIYGEGAIYELLGAADWTAAETSGTVYLWGRIKRTAADATDATALDTYSFELSHNLTGTSPGAGWIPFATAAGGGAGLTALNDQPAGKFLRLGGEAADAVRDIIPAGQVERVPVGYQKRIFGRLRVQGRLTVQGRVRVEA